MALIAFSFPILPGKKQKWQEMMDRLSKEPLKSQMVASRQNAGVHERTFLQEGPNGDVVIVTLEGDNPLEAFGKMMGDPAMRDFAQWAADVHGFDPGGAPPPIPRLVFDSKA